jgi:outer membrane beta-barrel protein
MESRIRVLLLIAALAALTGCASVRGWFHHGSKANASSAQDQSAEENAPPRVIEPEVSRRKVKVPRIRSSDWEFGAQYGALSIENFGTHPSYGATLAYHISEDFFFQAEAGRATAGQTSFETLSQIQLLTPSERHFTYYDLSLGYNFLPGEAFVGRGLAMTSAFYLLGGIGGTDFAGDTKFTVNVGAGYRVVPADWLALHVTVQDHILQESVLGYTQLTNNLEALIGVTVFF